MAKLRGFMAAMALLSPVSRAKEMPVDVKVKAALYDSRVMHQEIVSMKLVSIPPFPRCQQTSHY